MEGGSCTARNAMRNIRLPSPSTHGTSIFAATVCRRSRFTPGFCRLKRQRGGARSIGRFRWGARPPHQPRTYPRAGRGPSSARLLMFPLVLLNRGRVAPCMPASAGTQAPTPDDRVFCPLNSTH